ncbi:pentapeptide repeat-containing protein [Microcoleus sp. FACHB-53]|jgi:uncharacterized protein YjbI with pentapeptide repeats|nr:pentapeptide repeat-containing protein [Microcoleus sp. FACHB-53]MBD2130591.1 pentapeptide repeat-containing protein [Microcoleus sp. FACHB-1]
MANEEHLSVLRQGVEAWNEWKANNPEIRPNLSFANGKRITIRGAKLSGVDLSRTNLSRADLSKADLIGAKLNEANLSEAYLSEADLIGADLNSADLSSADLIGANLIGANLNKAYLSGADLTKANLSGADLVGAKLIGAKLSGANLSGAKLIGANLSGAYLRGANLKGANLIDANLIGANLSRANLHRTKALHSNLYKAILTGACLQDWHTNSATNLEDVICDYIYLQVDQQERRPIQGNFAPGEFTNLFQKALETVDLIFSNGIDWQAFLISFEKIQIKTGILELSLQTIENKNDGTLVIRLSVPNEVNKTDIEHSLKREYEHQLKVIDKIYRYQLQATYEEIATYRHQSIDLIEIVKVMASRTINVETQYLIERRTVSDAAAKIQKLLQQLEQTYPTSTPLEKQIVVIEVIKHIESNPTLKMRVVEALKGVSIEALKELIDHPLVNVLLAALEEYQEID